MSAAVATATIPASAPAVGPLLVSQPDLWEAAFVRACREGIMLASPITREPYGAVGRRATCLVGSSSGQQPYAVVIEADPLAITAACSCPGGRKGQRCKHVAAVLAILGLI